MKTSGKTRFYALLASLMLVFTLASVDYADARRGGSFGSRGTRTFSTPAPTRTAPNPNGPVQRSMTPNQGVNNPAQRQNPSAANQQRPGGLFSGGLMRGLLMGGLFGALLGYGFGGAAGMMSFLLQLLIFGAIAYFIMGFLRRRQDPATAGGPSGNQGNDRSFGYGNSMNRDSQPQGQNKAGSFNIPGFGGANAQPEVQSQDIELTQADLDTFEKRLGEVQSAYGAEDFAALRRYCTPEIVSFFSEELADNAKAGVRNDVSQVRLLQADIAESWREGNDDYATAAFQYESIDVMRDRQSGQIVEGDNFPTETTEIWTFVRPRGGEWKLSAIQDA